MQDLMYIMEFLRTPGVEGRQRLTGYIPCTPRNYTGQARPERYAAIGVSGVTIATGCDLGQTDAETLLDYGLASAIVNRLRPYFGLKQEHALRKLHILPLTVAQDTADAIDLAVHAGYWRHRVAPAYQAAAGLPATALPRQAQAVLFSLCFNYGCGGFRRRAPNTWAALVRQDWQDAARRLGNRKLWVEPWAQSRRAIEGRLLQEVC